MDTELNFNTNIKRKEVDLFDLPTIINLYYTHHTMEEGVALMDRKKAGLTTDFGMPIFAYTLDKKVVAYTMVFLNEAMEREYKLIVDKQYVDHIVPDKILSYARGYDERNGIDTAKLKNAILRFVDWLNRNKKNRA